MNAMKELIHVILMPLALTLMGSLNAYALMDFQETDSTAVVRAVHAQIGNSLAHL